MGIGAQWTIDGENTASQTSGPAFSLIYQSALEQTLEHLSTLCAQLFPLRISVLLYRDDTNRYSCTYWRDGALCDQAEHAPFLSLCEKFLKQGTISSSCVLAFLDAAAAVLPDYSVYSLPLNTDRGFSGAVLLGRAADAGPWTEHEQMLVAPLSKLLSISLSCRDWMENCAFQNWLFNEMMDNMNACLYITDVDTDQIIFMNKYMRQIFGVENPEGLTCWEVLQNNMNHRCDFCPVPMLLRESDSHPTCIWEEHNTHTNRIYENHDSLMRWTDGRIVHVQQSLDVTETKRLYMAATVDELTGVLNRRAGREALTALLERGKTEQKSVTVCMFDINALKEINAHHGRHAGDEILVAVAQAVRKVMKEPDCLFRTGGDEFVIGMLETPQSIVSKQLAQVQDQLSQSLSLLADKNGIIFSLGILELPPSHMLSLQDVIDTVDEKLYEQTRFRHIRLAQTRLSERPSADLASFDFDKSLLYEALCHSMDDYPYVSDVATGTFRYPKAMVEEFGLPSEIVPNAAAVWGSKIHPDDRLAFLESNQEVVDGRSDSHCIEYRAKNTKGDWVWLRCRGHMEYSEHGAPTLFAGVITNLGKRNRIDHLTGLLNKTEFEEALTDLLQRPEQQPLALLIFGIDDLKHLNSLYDRNFGDEVIRITSQKLQSMLPSNGTVFRLDGDEFGVILRDVGEEDARAFYHRVQASFGSQHTFDGGRFFCTLSSGCACAPLDGADCKTLIKYAHFALDHAKKVGKNQICFFSQDLLQHLERMLDLTELLRESIEENFQGFELNYQPIFSGQDNLLVGAEALCRWHCEKYGAVSPVEFIPLLEQSGLILPVGRWIFKQALATCAHWKTHYPGFIMGVNLSNLQLEDPTFINFLEDNVQASGVLPSNLVVELTESYLASNVKDLGTYLNRLRALGIRISMDDFGTGYSALSILKQYPIDIVKIDRMFIKGILSNSFDAAFIQSMVDLCRKLGVSSCLEGVETRDELDVVVSYLPDYLQGFFFSRPIPLCEFEKKYFTPEHS